MNDDLKKYPVFEFINGFIFPSGIRDTKQYNHYELQAHHFVRKTMRKTNPKDYERFEKYQKIIIMPAKMNYDIENMGAETFKKVYNIDKWFVVFDRKKWREGLYDSR
jgi:hypothetical protein